MSAFSFALSVRQASSVETTTQGYLFTVPPLPFKIRRLRPLHGISKEYRVVVISYTTNI